MIRAILLASVSFGVFAQTSVTGLATCQCLGALPESIERIDCNYTWGGDDKKCVKTVGLVSNFTTYASDYGATCKVHLEPGHASCFNQTVDPPVPIPTALQAQWCNDKWCYVDPCNCDASDATKSDYFPDSLTYSYGTCGDKNKYTAAESLTNKVGNSECIAQPAKAKAKAKAEPAANISTTTAAVSPATASDATDLVPSMMLAAILVLISA